MLRFEISFSESLLFDLFPSAESVGNSMSIGLYVFNFDNLFYVNYYHDYNEFIFFTGKSCIKYYAALFRF